MGSSGSRSRLRRVAPCPTLQQEGEQPKPQWTLPAVPVTMEPLSGSLGHKKTALPPLKQEIPLSTRSGSLSQKQSNGSSIIHAYPPRRRQALQPLALQIGHTDTAQQKHMTRGGGFQQCSTTGKTGHGGTSTMSQGAFLEAQTALSHHSHRQRQAHLRQGRQQRKQKILYTVNGDENTKNIHRLVRRPTHRDAFLDETGERLDPSCLLEPLHLPCKDTRGKKSMAQIQHKVVDEAWDDQEQGPNNRRELRTLQENGHRKWILDRESLWMNECPESAGWTWPDRT